MGDSAPAAFPASDVSPRPSQEGRQLWRAAIDYSTVHRIPGTATAAVQQSGATRSGSLLNAAAKPRTLGGWLQHGIDVIETATGVDIDGDGK